MHSTGFEFIEHIADLGPIEWNAITGVEYPFMRFEYLHAMEASHSVCARTGWQPCHLILRDGDGVAAVMPLYEKSHSWGEYVFDWSWAEAYENHRTPYYPKLISAIPFTPCEGARLMTRAGNPLNTAQDVLETVQNRAAERGCSSWHLLFPNADTQKTFDSLPILKRIGVQFHWLNPGCATFEEFLESFMSRKRKNVRKEREKVRQQHIEFRWLEGKDISEAMLDQFYVFYQATYLKRGQRGYLTRDFFARVLRSMPSQILLVVAEKAHKTVAAAWFFKNSSTLYGRYWGCLEEYDFLHFETCYYQGIDYCLANGLQTFDAGAQGEHKLLRGFAPRFTASYHWLADDRFRPAIADFLQREKLHVESYLAEAASVLPYRRDVPEQS